MFGFLDDKTGEIKTSDPISGKIFTELDFNKFVSWEIWTYKPVKTNVFLKKNYKFRHKLYQFNFYKKIFVFIN